LATDRRHFLRLLVATSLLALPPGAGAQNKAAYEVPMLDPWVAPGTLEKAVIAPPTDGEALRQQVRAKLKRRFDAAAGPDGTLTAAQARSAGLGAIADRFDAIDRAGRGVVRFEDYERFLELRR